MTRLSPEAPPMVAVAGAPGAPPEPAPAPQRAPKIGDIVLYVRYGLRPAIVTQVHREGEPDAPLDLMVFDERLVGPDPVAKAGYVPRDGMGVGWRWPA